MAVSAVLLTASCNKDDDTDPATVQMDVSPSSLLLAADDATPHEITVSVSWPVDIQALVAADWCHLTLKTTTSLQRFYDLIVDANTSAEPRSCSVKFFISGLEKGTLLVTQGGVNVEPEKPVTVKPENPASFLGLRGRRDILGQCSRHTGDHGCRQGCRIQLCAYPRHMDGAYRRGSRI